MNSLVSISAAGDRADLSDQKIESLPVLVLFPHNQCNCRCVMCDIWRIREAKEISPADLEKHLAALKTLNVGWVVFSGGEPQLNEKWAWLARMMRSIGSRVTLLTAGLLLESQARIVADSVDDVIVSLDGPPALHNNIRRIPNAFEQMAAGVRALRELRPDMEVRARCTIQKANHHSLCAVAAYAKQIGLLSVSFLAADLTSSAFNRTDGWLPDRSNRVALTAPEVDELELEIERLISEQRMNFDSGFVVESPDKLRRIVRHFRSHLQQADAVSPRCNAPWVSAVVEASGDVRPCFFHPVLGNIHQQSLPEILNGPQALEFRANLDVANNAICRHCVCSLYVPRTNEPKKH
jgi:MoaA/NifB/PqqE/SkfB family radical SAM enzyme